MIRRILLVAADASEESFQASRWGSHPLGLMYIAAAAREAFPDTEIRIFQTLTSRDYETALPRVLREFEPDLIGLRALSFFRDQFSALSRIIRQTLPGRPIIGGGPHVSSAYDQLLEAGEIDLAVIGEGEETFSALLTILNRGEPMPVDLVGTAALVDGKALRNEKRVRIRDLDAVPLPAYDLIDLEQYRGISNAAHVPPSHCGYIETSRGCPYRCFYCHIAAEKATHQRSPASVVHEMRKRRDDHGITSFMFVDDIFNFPQPRAKAVLRKIAAELPGMRLHFPIGLRADQMDEEMLDLFEAAGTVMMSLAVETVTPRLQRFIGKNLKIDRAQKMIDAASRRFICTTFFMAGFPSETKEEMRATIDYAASFDHLCDPTLNIVRVFRDTLLWTHLDPTPEQARRLDGQTSMRTTPRMFTTDPFVFYGDIFDRDKVPLTSDDIAELRIEWLQKVQFNPQRIVNSYEMMRRFLNEEDVARTYQSWLNDERFTMRKMQRMLEFGRAQINRNPPAIRQPAPTRLKMTA